MKLSYIPGDNFREKKTHYFEIQHWNSYKLLQKIVCPIKTHCGKFLKRWEYQTTWPASWEISMQVMKQQLDLDMEQQTSKRSTSRLYIVTLLI